jgi:tellurite resistance protein TerB
MALLDSIKKMGQDTSQMLVNEVTKFKNKDFLNAVIAGCALVAGSDGTISADEKHKMLGYIRHSDELKAFNQADVIDSFNKVILKFDFDYEIGKLEAFKTIAKLIGNGEASRLVIRVCCAIGAADGDFDANEKKMVVAICHELRINEAEFDLK